MTTEIDMTPTQSVSNFASQLEQREYIDVLYTLWLELQYLNNHSVQFTLQMKLELSLTNSLAKRQESNVCETIQVYTYIIRVVCWSA